MAPRKTAMKDFYAQRKRKTTEPAVKGSGRGGKRVSTETLGSESQQPAVLNGHGSRHSEDDADEAEEILRQFDLNLTYGPCLGVTRLERWERASKLGLNPPKNIEEILKRGGGNPNCLWEGDV